MNYTANLEKYETLTLEPPVVEQVQVPAKQALPVAPFPRKYVHSVFVDLQDARQAAQTLHAAGFGERDVYVMESCDFVEAVSQGQSPFGFFASMDYDVYLQEASRGCSFLAVRPANYVQLKQIRDLLVLHNAHLAKYIDTWTVAELLP